MVKSLARENKAELRHTCSKAYVHNPHLLSACAPEANFSLSFLNSRPQDKDFSTSGLFGKWSHVRGMSKTGKGGLVIKQVTIAGSHSSVLLGNSVSQCGARTSELSDVLILQTCCGCQSRCQWQARALRQKDIVVAVGKVGWCAAKQ